MTSGRTHRASGSRPIRSDGTGTGGEGEAADHDGRGRRRVRDDGSEHSVRLVRPTQRRSGSRHAVRRARRRRAQRGRTARRDGSTTIGGDRSRRRDRDRIDSFVELAGEDDHAAPTGVSSPRRARARVRRVRSKCWPTRFDATGTRRCISETRSSWPPLRAVRVVTTAVAFEQFDGVVDDVLDVVACRMRGRSTPRAIPPRSRGCERRRACRRHRRRSVDRRPRRSGSTTRRSRRRR